MGTTLTIAKIEEAIEENLGYCTTCKGFTRECTEPDAEDYDCPECGQDTVYGAETKGLKDPALNGDRDEKQNFEGLH